jgi:geranylgeranyl pyrophosphate synthase
MAKSEADIEYLRELIRRCGSIAYAGQVASRYARRFQRDFSVVLGALAPSDHRDFLADLADFTTNRQL